VEVPECAAPAWRRIAPPVAFVPRWVDLKEVYRGAPRTSWTACRLSRLRAVHLISPLAFFSVLQFLRSLVRTHPPAADEISHRGNDAIGLLNDHEVPGARDVDDLHPLAQLILECMSVAGRGDYVVETLDH
jgi:hypothetical protein